MTTPHVIASSSGHHGSQSATSSGIVGAHFRVGKKIGEGSFGVVFEGETYFEYTYDFFNELHAHYVGTNMLNTQPVAIKFVRELISAGATKFMRSSIPTGTQEVRSSTAARRV